MKKTFLSLIALFIATITFAYDVKIDSLYYDLNHENKTATVTLGDSKYTLTEVIIPSTIMYDNNEYSVVAIDKRTFFLAQSLSSITIPSSVTSIGKEAFLYTPWLENQPDGCLYINNMLYLYIGNMPENTHIDIKDGTTKICTEAFKGYDNLKSITIPNSVNTIEMCAFEDCESLTSVTLPSSITTISVAAFYKSDNVQALNITAESLENYCKSTILHELVWVLQTAERHIIINGKEITDVVVPESITTINPSTFFLCTSVTSVKLGNNVTSIGLNAFALCSSLTSIEIPNSVKSIDQGAFQVCTSLESIVIPNSVDTLANGAFYNCKSLTSINLSNRLKSIEKSTFEKCTSLKNIIIPDSVTYIGIYAFYECKSLEKIIIPNSVTYIAEYSFDECTSLAYLELGQNVTFIGREAFDQSILENLIIPSSVKTINEWTFAGCKKIKRIEVQAIVPPTITSNTFDGVNRNIEFIIPKESYNAYAEHEYWKEFMQNIPNNIENTFENINIFTTNGTLHIEGVESDYQIYNTSGQLVYSGNAATLTLSRGIYLVTIAGKTEKIVL